MDVPGEANQLMVSQKNCGVWNVEPSPQNHTFMLNTIKISLRCLIRMSHSHVDIAIKNLLENLKLLGGSSAFSAKTARVEEWNILYHCGETEVSFCKLVFSSHIPELTPSFPSFLNRPSKVIKSKGQTMMMIQNVRPQAYPSELKMLL